MMAKKFFLHIRFGLRVYLVDAKNRIFAIFSAPAISKNVIISDISGRTLDDTLFFYCSSKNLRIHLRLSVPLIRAGGGTVWVPKEFPDPATV